MIIPELASVSSILNEVLYYLDENKLTDPEESPTGADLSVRITRILPQLVKYAEAVDQLAGDLQLLSDRLYESFDV